MADPLDELRRVIRYQALLGVEEYPVAPAILARAAGVRGKSVAEPPAKAVLPARRQEAPIAAGEKKLPADVKAVEERKESFDIPACAACPIPAEERAVAAAGSGLCVVGLGLSAEELAQEGEPRQVAALLFRMIEAIGLRREDVAFLGLLPCPEMARDAASQNLPPFCRAILRRRIEEAGARVVIAFGPEAAQLLLKTEKAVSGLRGRRHDFAGRPLIATYHPAFLLRQEEMKKASWEDLKMAKNMLLRFAGPTDVRLGGQAREGGDS